ncbi:MAG: hypothetical protein JO066_03085 [Verrucomicrobia bacterium]|nr:hypothetical protein [Verrucomicrobiota bacterium]MBV9645272.1 hypothetical protein [Verrucomicrobiota bacterium]
MARSSSGQRQLGVTPFGTATKSSTTKKHKHSSWRSGRLRIFQSWPHLFACAFAVIAAGTLGVVAIVLLTEAANDEVDPSRKVLELTAQDVDPETTALEKNLLKGNQIDARLAVVLWRDARQQLSGASLKEAQRELGEGHVNPMLEPLLRQLAADFAAGKASAFTIWVAEDESQQGNAVDLQLDGLPLGRFPIEQNRYAITIVQRSGQSLRLEIIGQSAAKRRAVFRAETATSEAVTRHLPPGATDTWQLVVR